MMNFVVDNETGEVVSLSVDDDFQVDSLEACEWVLKKIMEQEAAVIAVEQTEAVVAARAVLNNAEALKLSHQRKIEAIKRRFSPELEAFAKGELEGQKIKTFKTLYGSISFRIVPERLCVKDEGHAIKWAKRNAQNSIQEKFLISILDNKTKNDLIQQLKDSDTHKSVASAFEFKEEHEAMTIESEVSA